VRLDQGPVAARQWDACTRNNPECRDPRGAVTHAFVWTWLALAFAQGCAHHLPSPNATPRDDVTLMPIADGVFVHTTWKTLPGMGPVASNGVLACDEGDGLLVDTAWNDAQTARLLDLAAERGCPVRALVVTHSHEDRMGGLAEVLRRGIATYALPDTVARARIDAWQPSLVVSPQTVRAGQVSAEVFFPGAAHAPDNVVVWLSGSKVLFGGCMVRAASGETLGNVADADIRAWPESVRRVIARYGDAVRVVPGHGATGGTELLAHTLALAEAAQSQGR